MNKSYRECSKAIARLENLTNLTKEEKDSYSELGISIFTKNEPINKKEEKLKCPGNNCDNEISEL
jgi:hypothetical protein